MLIAGNIRVVAGDDNDVEVLRDVGHAIELFERVVQIRGEQNWRSSAHG